MNADVLEDWLSCLSAENNETTASGGVPEDAPEEEPLRIAPDVELAETEDAGRMEHLHVEEVIHSTALAPLSLSLPLGPRSASGC